MSTTAAWSTNMGLRHCCASGHHKIIAPSRKISLEWPLTAGYGGALCAVPALCEKSAGFHHR